ncbi:single-stranded DNA-binding protein [Ginsengibacter hankyongi]|uniref:Single-stranded DNA-binding protein n=1 Tax=Ginsengibacter hankyongi TaxID=2607284 RepID=A0A5J5IJD8_9BACT|nr:single-stranded DNA-binding protein [Ginsengibacter hankyongi]KAA9040881.1 single-stranded DNA-binding protein [Ginsengibacter hankyongi]
MIKLQIVGNLGADCIQKEVNGKNVINFNVAHTEKFKDAQGNLKERTTWVNCAYWTDRTAVAQYLKKGKQVYVEGTPEAEAYTNKDNQPAATLRMRVRDLQLLGGNTDGSQGSAGSYSSSSSSSSSGTGYNSTSGSPASVQMEDAADDLPF